MAAPNTPQDIIDRIRRMEREIRELKGRANIRPALNTISGGDVVISNGGGVSIEDGGQLSVRTTDNDEVFKVGNLGDEYGVSIRRQTGELALTTINETDDSESVQEVRVYDVLGNVILGGKSASGWGLARPYVPVPMFQPQAVEFSTNLWATAYLGIWQVQNPNLLVNFQLSAGTGTTAEARVTFDDEPVGQPFSVTGGSWTFREQVLPAEHQWPYGMEVDVRLEVRRTSGTGLCAVLLYQVTGSDR